MKSENTRNIAVGITALVGLGGLVAMLMLFGYVPLLVGQRGYELRIILPGAGGLADGSRVLLSGLEVGRIESIDFYDPEPGRVLIRAHMRSGVRIPREVRAHAEGTLLGGMPSLELTVPETTTQPSVYVKTDGTEPPLRGEAGGLASSVAAAVTRAVAQFEKLSEQFQARSQRLTDDLDTVTQDFTRLTTEWTGVGHSINQLVEPRTTDSVDSGQAQGNVATVVTRVDQRLHELRAVLAGIDKWVQDPELRDNIHKTAAGAADLTQDARKTLARADQLLERYVGVADDLSSTIGAMHKTLDLASKGGGTVGKLLNDPQLYNNLNDAAVRIEQSIIELKLLLEKTRKEGLPVKF